MAEITIRNLDDRTHEGLRVHARLHQRSLEAEIRAARDAGCQEGSSSPRRVDGKCGGEAGNGEPPT